MTKDTQSATSKTIKSTLLFKLFFVVVSTYTNILGMVQMFRCLTCYGYQVSNSRTKILRATSYHHDHRVIATQGWHSKLYKYHNGIVRMSSTEETITTSKASESTPTQEAVQDATIPTPTTDSPSIPSDTINVGPAQLVGIDRIQSSFLRTMRDRGYIHQCTNLLELDAKLNNDTDIISAYLGFDATADSLHVGSLLQIMILRHFQQSGHRPIVLIGGGTSKVGDPTGKDESRIMLTEERIQQNIAGISKVFRKFLHFNNEPSTTTNDDTTAKATSNDAIMVNNDDWLSQLKYLEFLREYGTHFTINRMLSFDSVRQRLDREAPFSFLEFNYMILQAYDFLELYRRYGTILQLGGSDQWGNMISGTELGRRCANGVQLFALTAPLITTQDGKKMGKTANGAVWLNADKLSEYDYWQFWRNTDDADVIRFLKLFTELPLDDIEHLATYEGADINKAKIILADEATALLHGRECLDAIHKTIKTMFANGKGSASTEGLPRVYVSKEALESERGVNILDLLVELKLVSSKKEARRLIQGGGARIGDDTLISDDVNPILSMSDFSNGTIEVTLRAGKKRAGVVQIRQD